MQAEKKQAGLGETVEIEENAPMQRKEKQTELGKKLR